MSHGNKLVEGMGGADWLAATGVKVDTRAANSRDIVGLVLPGGRSVSEATHATVYRKPESEGGGFLVRWWKVKSSTEADEVGEYESARLARVAAAIGDDLRKAAAEAAGRAEEGADAPIAA